MKTCYQMKERNSTSLQREIPRNLYHTEQCADLLRNLLSCEDALSETALLILCNSCPRPLRAA